MNDSSSLPLESELASFMAMARNRINSDEILSLPLTLGQYELKRHVGRGGMGDVYEAQNTALNRMEAIKFIRSKLILNPSAIERFEKEIEATAKLLHPNIVTVFNAGQYNGRHFMTMEFLEGMTVHQYVCQRMALNSPLTIKEAVDIIIQAARGLQFAHDKGFIHRDVKPGNLWIMPDGTVKVLDLGLVLPMTHGTSDVQLVGTPDFMAPEQCLRSEMRDAKLVRNEELGVRSDAKRTSDQENDEEVINSYGNISTSHFSLLTPHYCSPQSDIYSLGCTFFYLLTGHVPFEGEGYSTSVQKMDAQRNQALPLLSRFRKDIPSRIQTILNRMTAKDPKERYASMNDVIAILEKKPLFKPILLTATGVLLFGTALWWGLDKMVQKSVEKAVQNSDVQQETLSEPPICDIVEPFPVGQEAGEKLVRVVDGVEYVFRWCPPGTFMMGNPGVYISKEMSFEQMLEIVKSNHLLDEKRLDRHEKALQDILNWEQIKGGTEMSALDKKKFDDKRKTERNDLYYELAQNPEINTKALPRQVTLTQGFWMLDCEVTCQMWFSVMKDSPVNVFIQSLNDNNLNVPVRKVSWNDAMEFCQRLSEMLNVDVQLPTEAQWEYACRAGTEETLELRTAQAIYYRDKTGGRPVIVRSKAPNAWGLYDMPGNVEEWCSDWFEPITDSQSQTDPVGPDHSTPYPTTPRENAKVLRGGHYLIDGTFSSRSYENIDTSRITAGFRVCVPESK